MRLTAVYALAVLLGASCSVSPSFERAEPVVATASIRGDDAALPPTPPAVLGFVDDEAPELAPASRAFCETSAHIWTHSAALNMIANSNQEMNRVALANVAEWLERATFGDDQDVPKRVAMFEAFVALHTQVADDFAYDWQTFQTTTAYANHPDAKVYEAERADLVRFINEECPDTAMSDLHAQAAARADELETEFAEPPSTVVDSDTLPGHSIFTHGSGRLIASFPTAWEHDEARSDAIVDLIASPDIERFLANEAIDGVRLQLVVAPTLRDFRTSIDATATVASCERTNDLTDNGVSRLNITQTFICGDHSASIIGQYREDAATGLIIEASFDGSEASRADLVRLASIANSALWR